MNKLIFIIMLLPASLLAEPISDPADDPHIKGVGTTDSFPIFNTAGTIGTSDVSQSTVACFSTVKIVDRDLHICNGSVSGASLRFGCTGFTRLFGNNTLAEMWPGNTRTVRYNTNLTTFFTDVIMEDSIQILNNGELIFGNTGTVTFQQDPNLLSVDSIYDLRDYSGSLSIDGAVPTEALTVDNTPLSSGAVTNNTTYEVTTAGGACTDLSGASFTPAVGINPGLGVIFKTNNAGTPANYCGIVLTPKIPNKGKVIQISSDNPCGLTRTITETDAIPGQPFSIQIIGCNPVELEHVACVQELFGCSNKLLPPGSQIPFIYRGDNKWKQNGEVLDADGPVPARKSGINSFESPLIDLSVAGFVDLDIPNGLFYIHDIMVMGVTDVTSNGVFDVGIAGDDNLYFANKTVSAGEFDNDTSGKLFKNASVNDGTDSLRLTLDGLGVGTVQFVFNGNIK